MNWLQRTSLFLLVVLALTACGANSTAGTVAPGRTTVTGVQPDEAEAPPASSTSGSSSPTSTPVSESRNAPVTAIMQMLGLTGEPYATEGDPNAPITVIEFTDYGCPFCRRHTDETLPMLKQAYIDTGKVYYVLKDFPLVQLHPQAMIASEAAECAGDQGKYWPMHSALFSAPSEWDTTETAARASFASYAANLGLDGTRFDRCMVQGEYRSAIATNMAEGRRMGVTGTPSFIINGKLLVGAQSAEIFERVLERELKQLPQVKE